MILGILLLAVSLSTVAFAAINLRNCIGKGTASAYGHVSSREGKPGAFWISAVCSAVGVLIGLALSLICLAELFGAA